MLAVVVEVVHMEVHLLVSCRCGGGSYGGSPTCLLSSWRWFLWRFVFMLVVVVEVVLMEVRLHFSCRRGGAPYGGSSTC